MKRDVLIKVLAKKMLVSSGLSQSLIVGKTSLGREINQLEWKEIELGTLSNYKLKKFWKSQNEQERTKNKSFRRV